MFHLFSENLSSNNLKNKLLLPFKLVFSPKSRFYRTVKSTLGFYPNNHVFYLIAFTHRSASLTDNSGNTLNNERLEFLGDAVLNTVVADFLFQKFPGEDEGFLTQMRSKMVSREYLNGLAKKIGLTKFIVSHISRPSGKKNLYGDAFEAFIGAVYLDKGYNFSKRYIINYLIKNYIDLNQLEATDNNFKSQFIEWAQKYKKDFSFETDNDPDVPGQFVSYVKIGNSVTGTGIGFSKKEAEQNAAERALLNMLEKSSGKNRKFI